ncbi:MAG: hypothetical protein KBS62_06115 [Oscillospiraceae bacterium]|nr:hypothetical protein [Candidatus Ruminococcus equi]
MKKVLALLLILVLTLSLACCTKKIEDNTDIATEDEVEISRKSDSKIYKIGETWTVPDLLSFTITGVKEVQPQPEYNEGLSPEAVYLIDYKYENLGFEDDILEGLYMFVSGNVVDSKNQEGYSYYTTDEIKFPKTIKVGESCEAQDVVALDNKGKFMITMREYDSMFNEYVATFEIDV